MRKKWLVVALLVVLASLGALLLPLDLLPLEAMSQEMTLDADGSVYMVSNDNVRSRIITADYDGRVEYCYQESSRRQGRVSSIGAVAVSDGEVFFIRRTGSDRMISADSWELVKLDMATGETETLYVDETGDTEATGVAVSDRMVYVSCIGESSKAGVRIDTVELYRLNLEEENSEMLPVTSADVDEGKSVVTAVYGGGSTLCALLTDGTLVSTNGQLLEQVALPEGSAPIGGLQASNGYLWARGAQPGEFLTGTAYRMRAREMSETVLSGAATSSQLVLRVYTGDGKTALARSEGEDVRLVERLKTPFAIRLQMRWVAMLVAAGVTLLLALLVLADLRFALGHRLRSRLTASIVGLLGVFSAIVLLISVACCLQVRAAGTEQTASWYAQNMASTLTYGSISGGADTQSPQALLGLSDDTNASVACVVYSLQDGGETPVYASCDGLTANADILQCVRETVQRGYSNSMKTVFDGRSASLCAVPVRQAGEITAVLAALVCESDYSWYEVGGLGLFLGMAVLLFLICAIVMTLIVRRHLRPVVPLAEQMDRLAIGDTNLDEVACADDELGRLWQSLKELSVGMAIRDYELNMTLDSCRRFVPHSMEQLLGRGTVTEITAGDMIASDGALGLISFNDNEQKRNSLNDREFMDYVNNCFLSVSRSIRPQGGVMLTGGFDLSAVRVLFAQSPDKGVRAMLSLLGDNGGKHCSALLHHAHFLYGVAGTQDEAFPYLASSEVSFFSSKLAQLAETGCRLVVTDTFLKTLSERFSTRYIGFFASADGKNLYKLHEVLDCYGELERTQREQYDKRMQEAIRCFYQNDFYLARNLFLAILRMAPQDGIARWYLFACEHYFNAGVGEEARYDLFGVTH